jgi:UDP-N-acetylenolpyruvoylglucosamine reductase
VKNFSKTFYDAENFSAPVFTNILCKSVKNIPKAHTTFSWAKKSCLRHLFGTNLVGNYKGEVGLQKSIFLLGLGGMGMESLGLYLQQQGYKIYGWDDYITVARINQLQQNGFLWTQGLPEDECSLIYSSAVPVKHPFIQAAILWKWPVARRGSFLAQSLKNKNVLAIVGSHGKSSTTAYLIHFFKQAGIAVNYLLGAQYQTAYYPMGDYDSSAAWTLVEVDESDGTIEEFSPTATLVLNDDWDHSNYYATADAYKSALHRLCQRTQSWIMMPESIAGFPLPGISVFRLGHDFSITENSKTFVCNCLRDNFQEEYAKGNIFNLANVLMALGAFYLITKNAVDRFALKSFPGIRRRQEILLKTERVCVLSDYAHHPTELEIYLEYVKKFFTGEQWIAFEPHRSSRMRLFYPDFIRILKTYPRVFLGETYRAFEEEALFSRDIILPQMPFAQKLETLLPDSFFMSRDQSTISFIGAGNIDAYARDWVKGLVDLWKDYLEKNSKERITVYDRLDQKSTFGIGGEGLFFCAPKTLLGLRSLVLDSKNLGIPWYILGSGSNVLMPHTRYDGIVLRLSDPIWGTIVPLNPVCFRVGAGCTLGKMLNFMQNNGIGGFEFLDGIPGTMGGALRMNAGTNLKGIWERVASVEVMDERGEVKTLQRDDVRTDYRACVSLEGKIALGAVVKGYACESQAIKTERQRIRAQRAISQPKGISLGCFFKNTVNGSTGKLLDQLGLKGMRVGGAFVSPKHANFILNDGTATFYHVIELVAKIRSIVVQKTGQVLMPEVRILGEKWENIL